MNKCLIYCNGNTMLVDTSNRSAGDLWNHMEREKVCVRVWKRQCCFNVFFSQFIFIIFQGSWEGCVFQAALGNEWMIVGLNDCVLKKGVHSRFLGHPLPSSIYGLHTLPLYFLLAPCRESKGGCWSAGDWAVTGLKELKSPPKLCPTPPVTLTASTNRNQLGAKLCLCLHRDGEIILTAASTP